MPGRTTSTARGDGGEAARPAVSVVIPALHEAGAILATLERIHRLLLNEKGALRGGVEIVVVDGDPDGSTLAALAETEARGVVGVLAPAGRATQMNAGAGLARGEALLFLHADTLLPEGAFGMIERALRRADAGAFELAIDSPRRSLRLVAWMANLRSRLTRIPYGDQAQFFRADVFRALGCYPAIPIMEDVEIMRRLSRASGRLEIVPAPATTSARRWETEGAVFCTLRNWCLVALYYLGAPPRLLARFYKATRERRPEKKP